MAVTSIWPINRNPKVVIDYARNPEKTVDRFTDEMSSLHTIGDVIDYAADEMKTYSVPLDALFSSLRKGAPLAELVVTRDGTHPLARFHKDIAEAMLKAWNLKN